MILSLVDLRAIDISISLDLIYFFSDLLYLGKRGPEKSDKQLLSIFEFVKSLVENFLLLNEPFENYSSCKFASFDSINRD